ncbi:hypothetical protein NPIL_581741 [Nephila pilipes]|uniref:Uncharacterized protein n=1 Tax=Nephila pilipes TaxID=299642 RepID=A0A8X6QQR5_NEPPI|nr:hypothetical protein NPIL_581741 [Nephila pilipes]
MNNTIGSKEKIFITKAEQFSNCLKSWKPHYEVWPFLYGNDFLGILSAANGSFFMHTVRKELKLRQYAPLTCYLPVVGIGFPNGRQAVHLSCTIYTSCSKRSI